MLRYLYNDYFDKSIFVYLRHGIAYFILHTCCLLVMNLKSCLELLVCDAQNYAVDSHFRKIKKLFK